jgi:hypothetical protein
LLILEVVARGFVQISFFTAGGFHEPFGIDGPLSLGQYIRSIGRKSPFGAGSRAPLQLRC